MEKAGYPFILICALVTVLFTFFGVSVLAVPSLLCTAFVCWFFRDPERIIPQDANALVSPADGKIIIVEAIEDSPFTQGPSIKISIFMSVFNVHVNRIPCKAKVVGIDYYPGKFFSAHLDKASKENEHNVLFLETEKGDKICFVQIAGLIARRIVCRINKGDLVERGQRFGLIRFGSRLDVYLPASARLNVSVGDKVHAGETVLGYLL